MVSWLSVLSFFFLHLQQLITTTIITVVVITTNSTTRTVPTAMPAMTPTEAVSSPSAALVALGSLVGSVISRVSNIIHVHSCTQII